MIRPPTKIYMASEPINMRLSFDRLAAIVRDQLGKEPREELMVVFHNRRRTLLKFLWFDGTGYCVFYKRMDKGCFRLPLFVPNCDGGLQVSARELKLLLRGVDRAKLRRARARFNSRNRPAA